MNEIKFLASASEIASQIQNMLEAHNPKRVFRIAVAFWGDGALEFIENTTCSYQIICNLKSGGTNPAVIRSISQHPKFSIHQLNTLHAKVLIGDSGSLISSANFSINGLALKGNNSSTLNEAGVFLPTKTGKHIQAIDWFEKMWSLSEVIRESDLKEADRIWTQKLVPDNSGTLASEHEGSSESTNTTKWFRTVKFAGRPSMKQVYLRSAASIVALKGCAGRPMPTNVFKFLFTPRAYNHHRPRFEEKDGTIKLRSEALNYFIGSNGSIELIQNKRLKSFTNETVLAVSQWMLGKGDRPHQLEGDEIKQGF